MMRIAIGADHAGFKLKSTIEEWLRTPDGGGHQIMDVGAGSEESTDYPDYAIAVGRAVGNKRVARGILLCGTGTGMAMAANKMKGVRAAVAWNEKIAALASEHNHANVLCVPARFVSTQKAQRIIQAFLKTPYGEGRHVRRVKKIDAIEK